MGIAPYIKQVGRGKDGARALDTSEAREVFGQVLDRSVSDLEVGAFLIAMRIKAETVDELVGFLQAAHERCLRIISDQPVVVLPSYNGARKLPNLTALLAALLARAGHRVLVHGIVNDETRVTTTRIVQALGWPLATNAGDVQAAWRQGQPAFITIDQLCPPLARLLDLRWTIGLRGPGHTIVKLLNPVAETRALRVVSYTHAEYGDAHHDFLQHTHADAMLLRGTEGEPVADARRAPQARIYLAGQPCDDLTLLREDPSLGVVPGWPADGSLSASVDYISHVLAGKIATPAALLAQQDALVRALSRLGTHAADVAVRMAPR